MTRYFCLVDVFDTDGTQLGSEGETIELFPNSSDKRQRKRAAAIMMHNGEGRLREIGEEPPKKAKKKKKASYKTRQMTAEDAGVSEEE